MDALSVRADVEDRDKFTSNHRAVVGLAALGVPHDRLEGYPVDCSAPPAKEKVRVADLYGFYTKIKGKDEELMVVLDMGGG
jgi:hypothetical protein